PEAGHLAADGRRRDQGQVRGGAGAREDLGDEPDGRVRDGADLRVHPVRRSYEAQAGRADRGRGGRSERQGSMGGGTGLGRRPVPDEADGGGAGWTVTHAKPPGSFQDRSRGGREKYAAATSGRACNAGPGRWKRRDARG